MEESTAYPLLFIRRSPSAQPITREVVARAHVRPAPHYKPVSCARMVGMSVCSTVIVGALSYAYVQHSMQLYYRGVSEVWLD
jgi:hypothetical protein